MSRLLIIGCGGVAQVAIRKCCQNSEVFTDIMIASRTLFLESMQTGNFILFAFLPAEAYARFFLSQGKRS